MAGPNVYVGGSFSSVSGVDGTHYLARWDGSELAPDWNPLGSGLTNIVNAITVSGADIYVGGWFTDAGGDANADHIARWDGKKWNALDIGLNGPVYAIAMAGSYVYVGGDFSDAGGVTNAKYIARWDTITSTWNALGSGLNAAVYTLAVVGADIYAGGEFYDMVENANYIARWDTVASILERPWQRA